MMYIIELRPKKNTSSSLFNIRRDFPDAVQKNKNLFIVKVDKSDLVKTVKKARQDHFSVCYYEENWDRSNNYRRTFLKEHQADRNGKYMCWYCGRKVKHITVDHIIPVAVTKRSKMKRLTMKMRGIRGVNDTRNLALSCCDCNLKKGTRIGLYPLLATFGRFKVFWIMVWIFVAAVLSLISFRITNLIISFL